MKLTGIQWNNVAQREDKISQVLHRTSTQRSRYWQPQPVWMGRICFWESDATAFPRLWPRSLLILPIIFPILETELHSFCINFRKSLEKPALPQKKKVRWFLLHIILTVNLDEFEFTWEPPKSRRYMKKSKKNEKLLDGSNFLFFLF